MTHEQLEAMLSQIAQPMVFREERLRIAEHISDHDAALRAQLVELEAKVVSAFNENFEVIQANEALVKALAAAQAEVVRVTLRAENAEAAFDLCQENAERLGERRRDAEAALAAAQDKLMGVTMELDDIRDLADFNHSMAGDYAATLAAERTRREEAERLAKEFQIAKQAAYEDRDAAEGRALTASEERNIFAERAREAEAQVAVLSDLLRCVQGFADCRDAYISQLGTSRDSYDADEALGKAVALARSIGDISAEAARLRELAALADTAYPFVMYVKATSGEWSAIQDVDAWLARYHAAKGE